MTKMFIIESVQLENIEFSANYLHSIEQRMLAEVEVQTGVLPTTMVPGSAVPRSCRSNELRIR